MCAALELTFLLDEARGGGEGLTLTGGLQGKVVQLAVEQHSVIKALNEALAASRAAAYLIEGQLAVAQVLTTSYLSSVNLSSWRHG